MRRTQWSTEEEHVSERPNILIIITDQLSAQALPAYGDTYALTPNIDRVVRRGVRFEQCYTNCPLCQPARAAFWTGLFPHQTGVLSNGRKHPVPPVPEHVPTLGALFAAAGYETVHMGKTHDAGSLRGFTVEPQGELPVEADPAWPLNRDTFHDRYTTTRAVEYLESRTGVGPFLLVVDLVNPHNICGWVGENAYAHEDVPVGVPLPPLPANFETLDMERRPLPVQYVCCSHNRLSQAAPWNETNYRHYLAAYYHYLRRVDGEIGLVLDALEARPDAANTLVVFTSDHGDGIAVHRQVTKQVSMYDNTTRVPLAFAGPGVGGADRTAGGVLVSNLDLLPTLCDYAGIDYPEGLWGRSLLPWLASSDDGPPPHPYVVSEWHTEWGFTISPGRMVRTPRFKYVRYLEGREQGLYEELYDMEADPGETRNLAFDTPYAPVLEAHRALLAQHVEATQDDFFELTWVADPRWRSHPVGYANHRGPAAPMVG
ncbi:MAG: sulfatase-like hydrolase/transferase [Anaerolineae bacterium]|nr:sulfatase-like hydrolase/transferase [Anaerolineae bacterium]